MRISLSGDSPIIPALIAQFHREGYVVSVSFPTYSIELIKGYVESDGGKITDGKLVIHSSFGALEQHFFHRLAELTKETFLLHRGKSEFNLKVAVPQREEYNISHAIVRAVNELAHVKVNWLKRWLSR